MYKTKGRRRRATTRRTRRPSASRRMRKFINQLKPLLVLFILAMAPFVYILLFNPKP